MIVASAVRLGIIGAGRWGRICLRTLSSMDNVNLVAVASGNPETAAIVPQDCRIFPDWRNLLQSANLDGVIIATPPATHMMIAAMAIEAGLPLFVEKPLTLSSVEAYQLRMLAKKWHTRIFFIDHIHLFSPAFRRLKELVAEVGTILHIESVAGNYGPYRRGVAIIWDWGAHDVAMLLDLLGTYPDQVTAQRIDQRKINDDDGETICMDLSFGKTAARIIVSNICNKIRQLIVRCEKGTILYDDLAFAKLTLNGVAIDIDPTPPLTLALNEFATAICDGNIHLSGLDLGISVVEVLEHAAAILGNR